MYFHTNWRKTANMLKHLHFVACSIYFETVVVVSVRAVARNNFSSSPLPGAHTVQPKRARPLSWGLSGRSRMWLRCCPPRCQCAAALTPRHAVAALHSVGGRVRVHMRVLVRGQHAYDIFVCMFSVLGRGGASRRPSLRTLLPQHGFAKIATPYSNALLERRLLAWRSWWWPSRKH